MRDRGLRYWLPSYLVETMQRRRLRAVRKRSLTHILFLICDHFEPRHGIKTEPQAGARLAAWQAGYRQLQGECFERHGLRPLHTWFYPPHHGEEHFAALARLAFEGLGEVELHYHHDGDTRETLGAALRQTLARYHHAGLLLQRGFPPGERFGFIHGDWALDNSAGGRFCGVNGELSLLKALGCWADLTMPSANECQSRKINSIYYAIGSAERSKGYDRGDDAVVGRTDTPGLMLIQGPLALNFRRRAYPVVENASLTTANWGTLDRIEAWIDCHVHVHGRPEWLFVKLHAHGAIERDFDALFGERARRMHATLAQRFNDGKRFRLHYITARQAYNLVRAAEHGASGDPREFLDWEVPPAVTSLYCADAGHALSCCTPERLAIASFDERTVRVALRYPGLAQITGPLRRLEVSPYRAVIELPSGDESAHATVQLAAATEVRSLSGGRLLNDAPGPQLQIAGNAEIHLELAGRAEASARGAA